MGGNPIFNAMKQQQQMSNNNSPFGNFMNMVKNFNQFKSQFNGDPQQQVQQLIDSGKMSQEQFNQLSNMAKQFQSMMLSNGR